MHTGVATTPKKEWEVCQQPQRLSRGPSWRVPNFLSGNPRKVWLACPAVSPNVETWWYRVVVCPSPQSSLWLDLGSYQLWPLWIWNAMLLHSLALTNNLTNKNVFCVVPKKQGLVPNVLPLPSFPLQHQQFFKPQQTKPHRPHSAAFRWYLCCLLVSLECKSCWSKQNQIPKEQTEILWEEFEMFEQF